MSQRYEFFEWELAGGSVRRIFRAHIVETRDLPSMTVIETIATHLHIAIERVEDREAFSAWLRSNPPEVNVWLLQP